MATPFVDELWDSTDEMRKTACHNKNILQDAAYCYFVASALNTAMENAKKKDKVSEMLGKLKQKYSDYSQKVLSEKNIKDVSVIKLDEHYQKQLQLLNQLAKDDPINVVAAALPRAKLWKWLDEQNKGDFGPFNTHFKDYLEPHFTDHKDMEKLIENENEAGHVDKKKVKELFQATMFFEISVSVSIKT